MTSGAPAFLLLFAILPTFSEGTELVYEKRFGGTSSDSATAVAVGRDGSVYVAGATSSLNFPVAGGFQSRNGGAPLLWSADNGKDWLAPAIDAAVYAITPVAGTPNRLLAGTSNGVYQSDDGGSTWKRISPAVNYAVNAVLIDPDTPSRVYAASHAGVIVSNNGGVTWQASNAGILSDFGRFLIGGLFLDVITIASPPGSPGVLYAVVGLGGMIYRSTDRAASWSPLSLTPAPVFASTIVADPTNADVLYACTAAPGVAVIGVGLPPPVPSPSGVFKTTDGGNTWRQVAKISLSFGQHAIAAAPARATNLLAAAADGVWRSVDAGETWEQSGLQGLPVSAVALDPRNPTTAWALSGGSIYQSTDGGQNWMRLGPQVSSHASNITILNNSVFVSGDPGRDVFLTKWDSTGSRMLFSTYLGGSGDEMVTGLAVDAAGNAYLAGNTSSPDFPVTKGAAQPNRAGQQNAFVAKVSADGSRLEYATYLGGSTWESASGVAVDSAGAVYIAGYTESPDFPVTPGALQSRYHAGCTQPPPVNPPLPPHNGPPTKGDAFVAKLQSDGSIQYATYLGGSCGDGATGIAVDSSGSAYVVGFTDSVDFPVTSAFQPKYGGGFYDGFITKLDPSGGSLIYSSFLGGENADQISAIAVDDTGAVYLAGVSDLFQQGASGSCEGFSFAFTGHGLPESLNGSIFTAKLKPDGSGLSFGNSVVPFACNPPGSLALASSAAIWISGQGSDPFFPTVAPLQALGLGTGFVLEYDPTSAQLLFSTLLDGVSEVTLDQKGAVYVAGNSTSGNEPKEMFVPEARPPSALLVKLDPSLSNPLQLDTFSDLAGLNGFGGFGISNGVAPGEILELQGAKLGPAAAISATLDSSGDFPKTLNGIAVQFDGIAAPLLSIAPQQITCIVPFEIAGQTVTSIQVTSSGLVSNAVKVPAVASHLQFLALANPDGTVNSIQQPAAAGSYVTVYAAGLGQTNPPGVDGRPSPGPGTLQNAVSATIDNEPAGILYRGPAPGLVAGVSQINIALPAALSSGQHILEIMAGQAGNGFPVYVR